MMASTPTLTECIVMRTRPFTKEREDGKSLIGVFKPSHDDESRTDREMSKESQRRAFPFGS